jgi:hypothetical protein
MLEENINHDDSIWIADTGASIHMTTSKKGLVNIREITEEGTVTMGNGSKEKLKAMGNLVGQIRNLKAI